MILVTCTSPANLIIARAPDDFKNFLLRGHISYGRRSAFLYDNIGVVRELPGTVRARPILHEFSRAMMDTFSFKFAIILR